MSENEAESHEGMTFLEHLEELRQRLIKCLVAVLVGVLACWFFREELRQFLEAPLYIAWKSVPGLPAPSPLSFTSLMEPFVAYMKIAAIGGVFFASPVIFYHLWRFVSPGLYRNEKRMALPFVLISSVLFIVGSAGAYAYVFPIGFSFFLQFSSGGTVDVLESKPVQTLVQNETPKPKVVKPNTKSPVAKPPVAKSDNKPDAKKMVSEKSGTNPHKAKPASKVTAKKQKANSVNPKWKQVQKAYHWLEKKLRGQSCGYFSVQPKSSEIVLTYRYAAAQCGATPVAFQLVRNDSELPLNLTFTKEENGTAIYQAIDKHPVSRPAVYRLSVVREAAQKLLPVLMVKDYLDFAVKLMLAFGLVFELPILIFFLAYAGIVDYMQLIRFGRWFVVLALTVAAILTPPDVITQIMLATPLVLLYYLSIAVVFFLGRKRKRDE